MIDASEFAAAADALEAGGFAKRAGVIVGRTLKQAGTVVQRNIRSNARRHGRSGKIAAAVSLRATGDGMETIVRVHAGGKLAHLVVGGTSRHDIKPHAARALNIAGSGSPTGFAAVVHHPGTRPDPIVAAGVRASRPAIQALFTDAAEAMVAELADRITRRV